MIKFIIFSKDRPAQLDRLLTSINKHYPRCNYHVIYTTTDDKYDKSYYKMYYVNTNRMKWQTNLKANILELMTEECTAFLVDDMQFVDNFAAAGVEYYEFLNNPNVACLSLRMWEGINYSYTRGHELKPPALQDLNGCRAWHWEGKLSYWGYPMSLDGHIFKTADIRPLIESLDFSTPNVLEGLLALEPIPKPLMICYDKAKVVNYPLNLVQNVCKNKHMGIDVELMQDSFQAGHRLELQYPEKHNSCHIELQPIWR